MDYEFYFYDQIMLQNRVHFEKCFLPEESPVMKEKLALKIIGYALEYYLGWEPAYSYVHFTEEISKEMSLYPLIKANIMFPIELDKKDYYMYVISRVYPQEFPYDLGKSVTQYYKKILSGETKRFKNGFFAGNDGMLRANICLRYALTSIYSNKFRNYAEMYLYFSGKDGNKLLKECHLFSAARDLYEFPLDYLHHSLPSQARLDNLEQYTRLRNSLTQIKLMKKGMLNKNKIISPVFYCS